MPTPVWEVAGGGWDAIRAADGPAHSSTCVERGGLRLVAGAREGSCTAVLDSRPAVFAPDGTHRLVTSLNVDPMTEGAAVRFLVRARVLDTLPPRGERRWTPWACLGLYGDSRRSEVGQDPSQIEVEIDTVKFPPHHVPEAFEARLELTAGTDGTSPRIRRLALLTWKKGDAPADTLGGRGPAWGTELAVPERSQQTLPQALRPRCCSPTSLSMVLAFHGHDLPTEEVCRGVHDEGAKLYGNWSFNVAFAGRLGLRAVVGRCTSMQDLDEEIAAGRPVVLSHRYAAGEVQGAAVDGTDGHLIVARGITADGDVIVNDPAAQPGRIRRIYRRADLARSWLGNGSGICYLVRPET